MDDLLRERPRPPALDGVLRAVAIALTAGFLGTLSVAFARDPKPIRDARLFLATGAYGPAASALPEFLRRHDRFIEGWEILAQASAQLGDYATAGRAAATVESKAPKRAPALVKDLSARVVASLRALGCAPHEVVAAHARIDSGMGDRFSRLVADAAEHIIPDCGARGETREMLQLARWLAEEKLFTDGLADKAFVAPIASAIGAGRFGDARRLAEATALVSPELKGRAQAPIEQQRALVRKTIQTITQVATGVRANSERIGRFLCFPDAAPGAVAGAVDAWRGAVAYRATDHDEMLQCNRGFEIRSLGADGRETAAKDADGPAADFVYRYGPRGESETFPEAFWR